MSEALIEEPKEEPKGDAAAEPENTGNREGFIPRARFDEVQEQSKAARAKVADLEKQLNAINKANKQAEEERLKANEEYKTLAEKYQAELEALKPKAEIAEAQEKTLQDYLAAQIEELPEERRSLVPENYTTLQKLEWLANNKAKLMKPLGPDIGAGNRGGGREKTVVLTQEQKDIADKMQVSHEEYAKRL